jgi:putative transposase
VAAKKVRAVGFGHRRQMIEPNLKRLSQRRQCQLLSIARSTAQYKPKGISAEDLDLCREIDEIHMKDPTFGSRRIKAVLNRKGTNIGRKRVQRLMRDMGIVPIYRKPRLSIPRYKAKRYPYLLKGVKVERPDQVWCADITYIPMKQGHMYLVAVMDWFSRKVLSWRLSSTMDEGFCVDALKAAFAQSKKLPEIINTDQGSQFTGDAWIGELEKRSIQVSQDGKGRWMDNVFIERLWRSVKYEGVLLWEAKDGLALRQILKNWFNRYNNWRPHQALDYRTPAEVAAGNPEKMVA